MLAAGLFIFILSSCARSEGGTFGTVVESRSQRRRFSCCPHPRRVACCREAMVRKAEAKDVWL